MDQPLPSGSRMPNSLNGEGVLGKALDGPIDGRARKTGYTGYDRNTTSSQSLGIEGSDQVLLSLVEMRKQQRILALEFFGFAHPEIIPSPLPFVTLNFLRTLTQTPDLARGHRVATFNQPAATLERLVAAPAERHRGAYYIRLMVVDRPGVIADVAAALRDEAVSLESMLQRGRDPDVAVPVVLTTHETEEGAMLRALERIARLNAVLEPPRVIRIIEAL